MYWHTRARSLVFLHCDDCWMCVCRRGHDSAARLPTLIDLWIYNRYVSLKPRHSTGQVRVSLSEWERGRKKRGDRVSLCCSISAWLIRKTKHTSCVCMCRNMSFTDDFAASFLWNCAVFKVNKENPKKRTSVAIDQFFVTYKTVLELHSKIAGLRSSPKVDGAF